MKFFQTLKQIFLLWLVYKVLHLFFFNSFFFGFLTSFDFINSFIPKGLGQIKIWIDNKPFNSFSLIVGAFRNPIFTIAFGLSLFVFVRRFKQLSWTNMEYAKWLKLLVFISGFLLVWEFTTYDYNYYLDSYFVLDRILMICLLFGMIYHPICIPVFLIATLLFRAQFSVPIDGFPFFDKRVLFDLLILVYAFIFISRWKKIDISLLFLMLFCLIGGNYFTTGLSKILNGHYGYEWFVENKLSWLFLNAHSRGWLIQLSNLQVESIAAFLAKWSVLFQLSVLLLELSGILILLNRKWTRFFLIGTIVMHLAIFLTGSMFFWKWIAVDLFLLFFLWKAPKKLMDSIFSKEKTRISIGIILFSVFLFDSYQIGWHDTPYNQIYSYEVIGRDGETYPFAKNDFNPYHQTFQYDKFDFLNQEKLINISGFGYTSNYKLAQKVRMLNWDELQFFIEEYGRIKFNPAKEQNFKMFLKTYFTNYNRNLNQHFISNCFSAPHHIYNSCNGLKYNKQTEVKLVKIYYDRFFVENGISVLKEHKLLLQVVI